jgi:hypothetical protein
MELRPFRDARQRAGSRKGSSAFRFERRPSAHVVSPVDWQLHKDENPALPPATSPIKQEAAW